MENSALSELAAANKFEEWGRWAMEKIKSDPAGQVDLEVPVGVPDIEIVMTFVIEIVMDCGRLSLLAEHKQTNKQTFHQLFHTPRKRLFQTGAYVECILKLGFFCLRSNIFS